MTTNLFHFISLRPPVSLEREAPLYPSEQVVANQVRRKLEAAVAKKSPGDQARADFGNAVISSNRYLFADLQWKRLRFMEPRLSALLELAAKEPRSFISETEKAIGESLGKDLTLEEFVRSARFKELKDTLWLSYYANVLAVRNQAADRETIMRWIMLFWLLESLSDPELFSRVADRIPDSRPEIPYELFQIEPKVSLLSHSALGVSAVTISPAVLSAEKSALDGKLKKLRELKEALKSIYAKKERSYFATVKKGAEPRLRGSGGRERLAGGGEASAGGVDFLRNAPWRLKASDFSGQNALLSTLKGLGLEPEYALIPEVIAHVENAIARSLADKAAFIRKQETISVGSVYAAARR